MKAEFRAYGEPKPQGSKIPGRRKDGSIFTREANPALKPWRETVTQAATPLAGQFKGEQALTVEYIFYLTKPKSARRLLPWVKPDLDKLVRAVNDSISAAGVWDDDSRVTTITATKQYATPQQQPGVHITIREEQS